MHKNVVSSFLFSFLVPNETGQEDNMNKWFCQYTNLLWFSVPNLKPFITAEESSMVNYFHLFVLIVAEGSTVHLAKEELYNSLKEGKIPAGKYRKWSFCKWTKSHFEGIVLSEHISHCSSVELYWSTVGGILTNSQDTVIKMVAAKWSGLDCPDHTHSKTPPHPHTHTHTHTQIKHTLRLVCVPFG